MKYLIAGLIVSFACLPACSRRESASDAAATPETKIAKNEVVIPLDQQAAMIETQPAALSSEPDLLRVKGHITIDDNRTWRLGVRTMGSVTKVYAGLGDHVTKGQILARYHADEVRDSRALYRAAGSERDRAIAATAQAQRNLDRAKRLLELKAGSVQQIEQAQQDVATAQAAVRKAEIEVDRTRDLLEDDLKVPAAPSANREDETEDEVPILAPGDGFVLEKNITPGRTVEPDSVTFVIGDLSAVWMLASVRQEDLAKLKVGQVAYVTVALEAEYSQPAVVSIISALGGRATALVVLTLSLPAMGLARSTRGQFRTSRERARAQHLPPRRHRLRDHASPLQNVPAISCTIPRSNLTEN